MVTTSGLVFFLLFLSLADHLDCSTVVQKLSLSSPKFSEIIANDDGGYQFICTQPLAKDLTKAWSYAYIEIKSETGCHIERNVNISESRVNKEKFTTKLYDFFSSRFQPRTYSENRNNNKYKCYDQVKVPLFSAYCVDVQLDNSNNNNNDLLYDYDEEQQKQRSHHHRRRLSATYVFHRLNLWSVLLSSIGVALIYSSRRLSKLESFHYFSGVSLGMAGAVLLFLILLARFMPAKKTLAGIVAMLTGSSMYLWVANWLYFNMRTVGGSMAESVQVYLFIYFGLSAVVSGVYVYLRGPVTNVRALYLIEWFIKFIGFGFLYCGSSYVQLPLAIFVGYFVFQMIFYLNDMTPQIVAFISSVKSKLSFGRPKPRKLLTEDEYNQEGQDFTLKALAELKEHCQSPKCNTWEVVDKISTPSKFATFMNKGLHVSYDEQMAYDQDMDLIDQDDDNVQIDDYYDESIAYDNHDNDAVEVAGTNGFEKRHLLNGCRAES